MSVTSTTDEFFVVRLGRTQRDKRTRRQRANERGREREREGEREREREGEREREREYKKNVVHCGLYDPLYISREEKST